MGCTCITGNKNTGAQVCVDALVHQTGLILVHKLGSDKLPNKIDADLTVAYITSKLQAPNKLDRWYAIGSGTVNKNIDVNKAEKLTESYTDGSSATTVEGRMVLDTMFIQNGTPEYLDKLLSFGCGEMMAFMLDKTGKIVGQVLNGEKGVLYPKTINMSTYSPEWQYPSPTRLSGINLTFEFSDTDRDQDIRWISAENIGLNLNSAQSLYDVILTAVATSITVTTVTATDSFGFPTGPVLGLTDATDWELLDKDGLPVVISVTDDNQEGIYEMVHADATALYPLTIQNGTTPFAKNYDLTPTTVEAP